MNILQVSSFFKPSWEAGGVTRVSYEISKHLKKRGHNVTVYTTNRSLYPIPVDANRSTDVEGINVYYFENLRKYFPSKASPIMVPYYLPFVARKEVKNFDVIQLHDHRTLLAVIVHYYAQKHHVPYVVQAHGSLPNTIGRTRMKRAFDLLWGNRIINDAAKVIALNQTEADECRKAGVTEKNIEIMPNGIDLSEYDTLPKEGSFREKYGIEKNDKVILYVGRLDRTKGIDLLVKSFADVSNTMDDARLILLGPQYGYEVELKELIHHYNIENKVKITGFVTPEEKMAAFTDADVFVTPSFTGFPITFMEACLCGVPIITTNKGDLLDWIDNKVGYVVDYDQKALGEAIVKISSDEDLRMRFGEEAKNMVWNRFNWKTIVAELEEMYNGVV